MAKSNYKAVEDENGYLTLYMYNDEVEPENGIPISVLNIDADDWQEILKEANNRLVKLVESKHDNIRILPDLTLNVFRSLIAQKIKK